MTRTISATGAVITPYDPAALTILRAAPGARWDREARVWRWSVRDADLPRTIECARKLGLEIDPSLIARLEAGTDDTRSAAEQIERIETRSGRTLYTFQRAGVEFLARHERALLADDMGLGKTIQVLAALPESARVLVVCPATLKLNWAAECKTWRPDMTPVLLAGRGSFRWPEPGELVAINYDILPPTLASEAPPGVILVLDEAHLVKERKARRSKAAKAIQQSISQHGGRVYFLTGTPLLSRPQELWGVLDCLGEYPLGGWLTFCRIFNARQEEVARRRNPQTGRVEPVVAWVFGDPTPEVAERLRRCMIRRRKEEVLPDLPRKQRSDHWVNGTSKGLAKQLDVLLSTYSDELEDDLLPPFSEFSAAMAAMAKERVPAMLELVEQYEEQAEPLIVFSAHRAPIDELATREGWATITGDTNQAERQLAVERFQAGELRGIACTIQAGGVGITLTRGSHVLFVDRDWTPALNLQAEDRACRIGQTAASVQVIVMRSEHKLCKHLDRLLDRKQALIEAAVERETAALTSEHLAQVDAKHAEHEERTRLARLAAETRQRKIDEAARESEKSDAVDRIERRSVDVAQRAGHHSARALTHELVEHLRECLGYLSGVCDGARREDGAGFSKIDTGLGKALALVDRWSPLQARVAERLCMIYRRQLVRSGLEQP